MFGKYKDIFLRFLVASDIEPILDFFTPISINLSFKNTESNGPAILHLIFTTFQYGFTFNRLNSSSSISNMNQRKQNRKEEKDRKKRERELELERINHEAEMFRIEWEHKNNSSSSVNTIPLNKLIELMKKMEENKDPCPICFTNNEELEITLCGHIFCKKCIKEVKNNKCPMCRS